MVLVSELTYEGSFNVGKPAGEVMEFIRDLGRVAPCIPNVVSHSVEGGRRGGGLSSGWIWGGMKSP